MARIVTTKYAAIPAAVGLSVVLAACGGGAKTATTAPPAGAPGPGGGPGTAFRGPAASGQVASISGSSMEVQSQQDGQETVSWTPSTSFTATKDVSESSVLAGYCVTATGTSSGGVISAQTVAITQPGSNGSCAGFGVGLRGVPRRISGGAGGEGFAGGPGILGSGSGGKSGGSSSSGSLPSGVANLGIATGKVTSVNGLTITISGYAISPGSFRRQAASGSTSSSSTTTLPASTLHFTVSPSTTYTQRADATSSSLAVGECVTAQGSTDSTGAVIATSVAVTPAVNGSCPAGAGGRFFRTGLGAGSGDATSGDAGIGSGSGAE